MPMYFCTIVVVWLSIQLAKSKGFQSSPDGKKYKLNGGQSSRFTVLMQYITVISLNDSVELRRFVEVQLVCLHWYYCY